MNRLGILYAVLGAFGFSFKAILIKLAYRHGVDAVTLLALRMGFALPLFVLMGIAAERRATHALQRIDLWWLAALGILGYYLASFLDFLGLQYITAALERLILFLYPTLVILLSALFLGKPISARTTVAMGLCYLGILFAVAHDLRISGEVGEVALGSALVFGSALSFALYLMGNGQLVGRLGSARVTAWATSVACVLCIAQFMVLRPLTMLNQPGEVYVLAMVMAVFSTVLPVWLFSEAIRLLGAGPVSLTGSLGPVITIGLGWALLDEAVGPIQLLGAALVLAGVWVMGRGGKPSG